MPHRALTRHLPWALLLACAGDPGGGGASGASITGASITGATGATGASAATHLTTDTDTADTTATAATAATTTTSADPTTTTAGDPTAATSQGGPADCTAIADRPEWQLCASGRGTCEAVFADGAGCDEVCAAVGMHCAQVHENIDGACAPDLRRPPLGCDPPSGHDSDYCVCASEPQACEPTCEGKECGGDGCGGTCGECPAGVCQGGACVDECDSYPFPAASLLAERVGFGAKATGGDPAKIYTVTTLADSGAGSLRAALESDEPYWVVFDVEGTIKIGGADHRITVTSNKTIDGRGRDITINGTLRLSDARNVIINDVRLTNDQAPMCGQEGDVLLLIGEGTTDPATFTTRDIWIHHVELFLGGDGLIDLRGASLVTISWSHFHDHAKGMLMWQSRSGKPTPGMRVTMHHNYFERLSRRGPQFTYGLLHYFNNYQYEWYEFGAGSLGGGQMHSEANIYQARPGELCLDCPDPNPCGDQDFTVSKEAVVNEWDTNGTGYVRSVGDLKLEGAVIAVSSPDKVFTPEDHYEYTAEPAGSALRDAIVAGAGPRVDYCGG